MLKKIFIISIFIILIVSFVCIIYKKSTRISFVNDYKIKNLPTVCKDIKLGGFSDLYYKNGYLYGVTDKGPSSEKFYKDGKIYRTLYCPNYTTYLVKFKINNNEAKVVEYTPIKELSGRPISAENDSIPVDEKGNILPFNINGADVESLVMDKNGNYWLGEEYYPSIIKLDKNLKVVKRFAPKNCTVKNPKIIYNLPESFNNLRDNHGFEAMTYDRDKYLYIFSQCGFNKNQYISIVKFNIETEKVEKTYQYEFDTKNVMSATSYINESNEIISAERIYGKHYLKRLSFDDNSVVEAVIFRDLKKHKKLPRRLKIEGMTSDSTDNIYVINDNDFGYQKGDNKDSYIIEFELIQPVKIKKKAKKEVNKLIKK